MPQAAGQHFLRAETLGWYLEAVGLEISIGKYLLQALGTGEVRRSSHHLERAPVDEQIAVEHDGSEPFPDRNLTTPSKEYPEVSADQDVRTSTHRGGAEAESSGAAAHPSTKPSPTLIQAEKAAQRELVRQGKRWARDHGPESQRALLSA